MPTGTNITGGALGNGPSLVIPTRTTDWQPPPERRKSYRPPGWDRLPAEPPPPTAPARRAAKRPPAPRAPRTTSGPPAARAPRRPDLDVTQLVADYQAGATLTELARRYSTTHATARARLIKAGVTIDTDRRGPRAPRATRIREQYRSPIGPPPPTAVQRGQAERFAAARRAVEERAAARETKARESLARDQAAAAARQRGVDYTVRPNRPLQQYDRPIGPHRKPGRPAGHSRPAPADDPIVTAYAGGMSIPETAAHLGISVSTARRRVVASGTPMRDDRATRSGGRNRSVFPPGLVQHAAALYRDGKTLADVARVLYTGSRQAREALVAAGVTIRPPANERRTA